MKRGVIQLTQSTNEVLREMVKNDFSETLRQKLEVLGPQVVFLELNQEEVERLLDDLPVPDKATTAENQLRHQLGIWLQQQT